MSSKQTDEGSLFDKYGRQGVEPFENWETEDLAALEVIVNAELQQRCRQVTEEVDDFYGLWTREEELDAGDYTDYSGDEFGND